MILVLTSPEDVTADMVVDRLNRDAVPVLRIDPADFPGRVGLTATIEGGRILGHLKYGPRSVDLTSIRSIWVRRPGAPHSTADTEPKWSAHEARHAFWGTLRALPGIRWVNHPDAQEAAKCKAPQLLLAHQVGMRVPATLTTNSAASARSFLDANKAVVCKTVSGRQPDKVSLPTTIVPPNTDLSSITGTPTGLQAAIDKVADVRLTVIGDVMHCALARCGREDVRFSGAVKWLPMQTPQELRTQVGLFMTLSRLAYGAFDFAVDRDGQWWFLECNPAGQFGFIELDTGQPISQDIADYLAGGSAIEGGPSRGSTVLAPDRV